LVSYIEGGTQAEGVQEVLRKVLVSKRNKVTGELRRPYSKELYTIYPSTNINQVIKLRSMRWAGHVAHMRDKTAVYMVLVGRPDGKSPLGRPRCIWDDTIKMDLHEVGWGGRYYTVLAQNRER
jgi:hypothetical protein